MKKVILFSFMFLFLFSLVSSLQANPSSININKTENQDYTFSLNIKNNQNFKMFNITSSGIIQFDKFNLNAGENKTITAKIVQNTNYNNSVKIRGDYFVDTGTSNKTEVVYIDYNNGFSKCNLNLIMGDRVIWVNQVNDNIKLKNSNGNEIATIQKGKNYTQTFTSVQEFNYYATLIGLPFTETCNVNIMNTNGYVHNSNYDANLNLKLNVIYNPTTAQLTLFTDTYTISHNAKKDDVLKIKNTGSNKARNVKLTGDWMGFSENNFDLNPGEEKNIIYTITPVLYQTNQTNKTYNLNLKIEGNFNTLTDNLSVYIPYASINSGLSGNITVDKNLIENVYRLYCLQYPDEEICDKSSSASNNTQRIVSTIFGEDTVKDMLEADAEYRRQQDAMNNRQQEININQTNALNSLSSTQTNMSEKLDELTKESNQTNSVILFQNIFIAFLIFMALMLYAITNERVKSKISRKLGLGKGERIW